VTAGRRTIILVAILITVIVWLAVLLKMLLPPASSPPTGDESLQGQSSRNLNANVQFLGSHFVIRNNDAFVWQGCDLELNDSYQLNGVTIEPGKEFMAPAREFASKDGNRFSPATMKPLTLFIYL
jgi:hypothetical protein